MEAGFKNGVITLDEKSAVYYTGQEISGHVFFKLDSVLLFKAINLEIIGAAKVLWSEVQTVEYHGAKKYGNVLYNGYEEYFNYVQNLCGGQGVSQLPPRSYTLSFKFQIPHNVPSTFKGEEGQVTYNIRAYIEFPDPMMPLEEITKEFQVVAPYDLNKGHNDIKQPIELEFGTMYCGCCCFGANPLDINIKLPASGFCPRDVIPVSVSVQNDSSREVKGMLFQIVSKERYRSQKPRAEIVPPEKVVVEAQTRAVLGHTKRTFTCDLTLPHMVVPNLVNCSIMDLEYYFKVKVQLSGCNEDLEESSRIYLGMIPLYKTEIGWNTRADDQLPNGPLPDPSTPVTPGITTVQPSFPVPPVPAMSNAFQTSPHPEIGFQLPNQYPGYPQSGVRPGVPSNANYSTPSAPPMY